ncbi:uncharacterized protein A1O9_09879 [Exophiala aquamarina CBS 119918]|uniref:Uncharacterized protein n=1 Tax=Exophiala aquamarina CBS 119918 TaxID=1182545 RepID=A0A072P1T0_9EURO|nr:uncharacterized protein A1O9_09879 [Exophiala aquamarina CBS 119918]KEF54084.1 hypothetical protein A1O9_09879 [Exophiala aquamarina CBS 119918]
MNGQSDIVMLMVQYPLIREMDLKDSDGKTPLMLAVQHDHPECAEALVKWHANTTIRDHQHSTALDVAVLKAVSLSEAQPLARLAGMGAEEVLCEILQTNPSTEICAAATMLVALGVSAKLGRCTWRYSLPLCGRSRPHVDYRFGNTALHLAAQNGHTATVEALILHRKIQSGIELTPFNKQGATPLHLAAQNGHVAVVETLLNHWKMTDYPYRMKSTLYDRGGPS